MILKEFDGINIFESEELFRYVMQVAEKELFGDNTEDSDLAIILKALNRKEDDDFSDIYDYKMSDKCKATVRFIESHRAELGTGKPDCCTRLVDSLVKTTGIIDTVQRSRWGSFGWKYDSSDYPAMIDILVKHKNELSMGDLLKLFEVYSSDDYSVLSTILEKHKYSISRESLARCAEVYNNIILEEVLSEK